MSARPPAGTRVPPDQEQRDRIKDDLDSNFLVEAAAGTGKTASMIDRMVALLRTGRCHDIATLAAVTFTRKAASELRTRFQARLEYEATHSDGADRERLQKALGNIDQCFIGTIHSFCARLLRERPVEAKVDLAFREIEPEEDERLRKEAWGEYAARLIAGESPEVLEELTALGMTVADLEQTFIRFADFPDVEEWPVPGPEVRMPATAKYIKALREYARRMRDSGPLPEDPLPPSGGRRLVDEYRRLPLIIERSDLDDTAVLAAVLKIFDSDPPSMSSEVKKRGYAVWAKEEQGAWKEFRAETAHPFLEAIGLLRYRVSITAMAAARVIYDDLRWRQGCLNFQDLLMKSRDLLRDKPHVRDYFAGRFTHLLVDEFQDTDPIQAEVMLFLTATDRDETDWKKCRPRPGALFVVGDPKQSIYRFRRADIVTYNEVKRIIVDSGGDVLELSANFRAAPDLIGWTNDAFRGAFPSVATDQSPAYVELHPGREPVADGGLCGVSMLGVPGALCKGEGGARGLEYEADLIARSIRCAIDSGSEILRAGEATASAATPGDFMIICYNKRQLSEYARKLQQYGVPHRVSGGSALNEVWELSLLHTLLNAVVQSDNPVALVAVLRSELFGVSDAALYDFKKAGGRFNYRTKVPDALESQVARPVSLAFERLTNYSRWLQKMPAVAAIERIVADVGLMVLAASKEGGDIQAGSVAKAIELLRGVQDEMPTTAQLVDHLGDIVTAEAQSETFDGISAVTSHEDVVRVMNLHKAKGLQAPVVFLAGPKTSASGTVSCYIDRSAECVRGYMPVTTKTRAGFGVTTHATPQNWADLKDIENTFQEAERTRLVYVGATRAEAMLVVTQDESGKSVCIWSALRPQLADAGALAEPGQPEPTSEEALTISSEAVHDAGMSLESKLQAMEAPTFSVRAAKEFALSGESEVAPRTLMSFSEPGPGTTARVPEGEHGVEWGGVVHQMLEFAIKSPAGDFEAAGHDALAEEDLDPSLLTDLVDTVHAVMSSEVWLRAGKAEQVMSEVPFEIVFPGPAGGEEAAIPVLVRGSIDLAFLEDGGWVIVDYKTDSVPGDGDWTSIAQTYAPQVRLYARAFEQCTGQTVKQTALYFVRGNNLVELLP